MTPTPVLPAQPYAHPVARALLDEALTLLGDGVSAASIEATAKAAGMSMGPLECLDLLSIGVVDHALHAAMENNRDHASRHAPDLEHLQRHGHDHDHDHNHGHDHNHNHDHGHDHDHGHAHACAHHDHSHGHDHTHAKHTASRRMHESAVYVVEKMAHGFKRVGRAAGAGFYDYGSEPASLWSGLKTFERRARQLPVEDIRDRMLTAATLAALDTPPSADDAALTSVLGPSVPVNRDAAAQLLSGAAGTAFSSRARELAARFGARFEPPAESHAHAS